MVTQGFYQHIIVFRLRRFLSHTLTHLVHKGISSIVNDFIIRVFHLLIFSMRYKVARKSEHYLYKEITNKPLEIHFKSMLR